MLNVPAHSRLPLSRCARFESSEFDEAAHIYSRLTTPVRIHRASSKGAFCWRAHQLALGPLVLSTNETTAAVRAECPESDAYLLSFTLSEAPAVVTNGKVAVQVVRGRTGLLASPGQPSEVQVEAGNQTLQLNVPRNAIGDAMRTLTGSESREPQFQRRIVLESPHVAPFLDLITQVLKDAELDRPLFSAPGAGDRLAEALLFRLLLAQPNSHSALFAARPQPAEPRHVRRAADYLDTHFERAITMAELTRLTGVSARSLQGGFQKHRGCSPLEFVRTRRLERARVLLLTSDTAETVTEVAQLVGITHLGRFSIRYRAHFGESPSQTLARRWSRAAL